MSTRTKWGFASACLTALGLFWGCGGALGSNSGGESHFLAYCDETCEDGLSCISGVCTRACVLDEDDCDDLHADAKCSDSIEPGAVAMCDVACTDDEQCESLGANYACEAGQCRGTTRVASSGSDGGSAGSGGASSGGLASSTLSGESETSGGAGGTTNGAGSTAGAGGATGTCDFTGYDLPDGASYVAAGLCETCTCTGEGSVVTCESMDEGICVEPVPVFACPSGLPSEPVDVRSSDFHEDLLMLEVTYSGGCEQHNFGLCYAAGLDASAAPENPVVGELRLYHDANDDPCLGQQEEETFLYFDLRPYAEYVKDELDVTQAVVDTSSFGLYEIGEWSCDDTWASVDAVVNQAAEQTLSYGCVENIDCARVSSELSCHFTSCGELIALGGEAEFRTTMQAVEATVCDEFYRHECPIPSAPPCDDLPAFGCVDGVCVEFDE